MFDLAWPVWKDGENRAQAVPKGSYRVTFALPPAIANNIGEQTININKQLGDVVLTRLVLRGKAKEAIAYTKVTNDINVSTLGVSVQGGSLDLATLGIKKIERVIFPTSVIAVVVLLLLWRLGVLKRFFRFLS